MSLYDLQTDHVTGMARETQDQVFQTCMSKIGTLLGLPEDDTQLLERLKPALSATCTNVTHLAAVMYLAARPLDLDRISPPSLAQPLYGVLSPALIVLSLVLNGALVALLVFRRRRRTAAATGVLLGGVAVLDGLTGLLQLPFLLHVYALGGQRERYPDMDWCRVFWYASRLLPSLTHTASLWLAAMLALQRHLGVCRRSQTSCACARGCRNRVSKALCSVKGTAAVVALCVVFAGVLHALQTVFFSLQSVRLLSEQVLTSHGLDVIDTCSLRLKDQSLEAAHNYVYTWLRLLLAEFIPCFLIGCFNVSLVRVTRSSVRYRRSLVHGHRESEKQVTMSRGIQTVCKLQSYQWHSVAETVP